MIPNASQDLRERLEISILVQIRHNPKREQEEDYWKIAMIQATIPNASRDLRKIQDR